MLYRILSEIDVPVDEEGMLKLQPTLFACYKIRRGNRKKTTKFFVGKKPWVQWPIEDIRDALLANPRWVWCPLRHACVHTVVYFGHSVGVTVGLTSV
jgi:hypothetical protein